MHAGAGAELPELDLADIDVTHVVRLEVDVIAQVGHVPVEGRRVGHHAERVVEQFQFLVGGLDRHRIAVAVMHDEMNARDLFQRREHDRHQDDLVEVGLDLLDGGEIAEQPGAVFVRRHGARGILRRRVGIARKAGEIEQADIEAMIVDAVEDRDLAGAVGAADAVFRGVTDALAAVRKRSRHGGTGRNDQHIGLEVDAELQGPRRDDAAVLGDELNSRAGLHDRRERDGGGKRCDRKGTEHATLLDWQWRAAGRWFLAGR